MNRLNRKSYYLNLCKAVAQRSPCPNGKQHGAIIVVHDRPVATGYNGPPAKQEHCYIDNSNTCPLDIAKEEGLKDWQACNAVHAEINAVITAALAGTAIAGGTLYLTKKPCTPCWRILANCKLQNIIWSS
jgi:dCMP deaminase